MLPLTNDRNKSNLNESAITRFFSEGNKVACRDYLNKNSKWLFGTVIQRLDKLHYYISLENGNIWKCHINQIRGIGDKVIKSKTHSFCNYEDTQLTEKEPVLGKGISSSENEPIVNEHTEEKIHRTIHRSRIKKWINYQRKAEIGDQLGKVELLNAILILFFLNNFVKL